GELKLRLHLVLQVVDRLPGGVERLDFEIRPVVAVLTKEEPHPGVHERAFADPIVAVDGGVGPAQLQSELADTFEIAETEGEQPHTARPLSCRSISRRARHSIRNRQDSSAVSISSLLRRPSSRASITAASTAGSYCAKRDCLVCCSCTVATPRHAVLRGTSCPARNRTSSRLGIRRARPTRT